MPFIGGASAASAGVIVPLFATAPPPNVTRCLWPPGCLHKTTCGFCPKTGSGNFQPSRGVLRAGEATCNFPIPQNSDTPDSAGAQLQPHSDGRVWPWKVVQSGTPSSCTVATKATPEHLRIVEASHGQLGGGGGVGDVHWILNPNHFFWSEPAP